MFRYEDVHAAANDGATFSSEGTQSGMGGAIRRSRRSTRPIMTSCVRWSRPPYSPRRTAQLEPRIRAIAGGLLDDAADAGRFDLKGDFAGLVPNRVISELIGIPLERHDVPPRGGAAR